MFSKRLSKYVQSLHRKKNRQKYNKFIAQGSKIAKEILLSDKIDVEYLFLTQNFILENQDLLTNLESKVIEVKEKELISISTLKTPNEALLVCQMTEIQAELTFDNQWTLFLDRVQDPGNVGTIVRIADWFGVQNLVFGEDCAEFYNPKVIQSTMGGFLRVQAFQYSFEELMSLKGETPLYSTALEGDAIYGLKLQPGIVVIGNESKGIQKKILDASDRLIHIPGEGQAESLNASVASGIVLSHLLQ